MKYVGNVQSQANAEVYATASGTLPNGKPVIVNSDGTVSLISGFIQTQAIGSNYGFPQMGVGGRASFMSSCLDPDRNKIIVAFSRDGPGYALAVSLSSNLAFSFGAEQQYETGTVQYTTIVYDTNSDRVVIAYRDTGNSNKGTAVVGAVNADNSITFGTPVVFEAGATIGISAAFDTSSNKVVIGYQDVSNSGYPTAIVGTVNPSNNSISFGTAVVVKSTACSYAEVVNDPNAGKIVYIWNDNNAIGTAAVGTVSSTTISFGTHVEIMVNEPSSGASFGLSGATFKSDTNQVVVFYQQTGGTNGTGGYVRVGAISGTNISFGDAKKIAIAAGANSGIGRPRVVYDTNTFQLFLSYLDAALSNKLYATLATVSGTTVTQVGTAFSMNNNAPSSNGLNTLFDTNSNRVALFFTTGQYGYAEGFTPGFDNLTLTAENFVGITNGVVDYDEGAAAVGSEVVFEAGAAPFIATAYDSNANRVVVAYRDNANSTYGTAVVGTISGTSVSFGTPVVYKAARTDPQAITFDSNSNKVVITYNDHSNSNYGTAVVGTVSGTTISFGSAAVFESANVDQVVVTFDSNSNKVVVAYRDLGNSNYATCAVGTVSGTNISFGTPVIYQSSGASELAIAFDSNSNKIFFAYADEISESTSPGRSRIGTVSGTTISIESNQYYFLGSNTGDVDFITAAFDSSSNKIVVAYRDRGNNYYGTAVVATVSGTSISYGTPVVFNSAGGTQEIDTAYYASAGKMAVIYKNQGSNNDGTVVLATISGTSISFDPTTTVFNSAAASYAQCAYDSTAEKLFIAYADDSNSSHGTGIVYNAAFNNTVRGSTASGSTAIIQAGGAISTLQTGLTAGQQYFVQTDGTLGLTADDPSVIAGTAVSATDLIVKG